EFDLAVADDAVFQILNVAGFERQSVEVLDAGLTAKTADLENRGIRLVPHAFAIRAQKLFRAGANVYQARDRDLPFIGCGREPDHGLVELKRGELFLLESGFFVWLLLQLRERRLGPDRVCGNTDQQGTNKPVNTR